MIDPDSDLFYDIYNTINKLNWRFMLSIFECITRSLSLSSLEEIKGILDWIFDKSDFLRLIMF